MINPYKIWTINVISFRFSTLWRSSLGNQDKGLMFHRLHFYLQTKFQMAPDNEINWFDLTGRKLLATTHVLPKEKIEQEKNNKTSKLKI